MRRKVEEQGARRRPRRSFTASFKAGVIALVRQGDWTIPTICRELDLSETAVRTGSPRPRWTRASARAHDRGAGRAPAVAARGAGAPRRAGHPEAGGDFLRDGDPMSRYRFIEAESSRYSVTQVSRIVQVSRTAYYEWQERTPSAARASGRGADGEDSRDPRGLGRAVRGAAGTRRAAGPGRGRGPQARGAVDEGRGAARASPPALGAHDAAGPDPARDPRSRARAVRRPPRPTCCGSVTSPTSARGRAGCTWRRSSTSSRAA